MNKTIELALTSPDGIIDCMLEPIENESGIFYDVTILYPNISGVFCSCLKRDATTGAYFFDETGDIHPKIKRLESQLSAAIADADNSK